jgi:hypothetical protein
MRFAVTKGEQTLSELATRLYAFEGEPPAAAMREAERALTDANPFLRKPAELAEGTVLVVPPLARTEPSDETRPLTSVAGETAAGALHAALAGAAESIAQALKEERDQIDESIATLRSREVKALVRADPDLDQQIRRTTDAAKSRAAEIDALERYQREALSELGDDLRAIVSAFGETAPMPPSGGGEPHE